MLNMVKELELYKDLLSGDYGLLPAQITLLESLIQHNGNIPSVLEAKGQDIANRTNIYRSIKAIKKRASLYGFNQDKKLSHEMPSGYKVKGTSTLYKDGEPVIQWVKTDQDKASMIDAFNDAITEIANELKGKLEPVQLQQTEFLHLMNNYISNDIHFGAYMWGKETGDKDYDLAISEQLIKKAIDYLMITSPKAKYAVISDLGDMLEADDFKNATPTSGHNVDVDGRYQKILRVAIDCMIYFVQRALEFHEKVYFINIGGNHDPSSGPAIREAMRVAFMNEPRAVMDDSPRHQKYLLFGQTLIGYAHGDGLKMHDADGTMTVDCMEYISNTTHREYHFGHNHKDKVVDGKVCRSESHRNIAPLNGWASWAGFRRGIGTMKCITYCPVNGRKNVNIFNIDMQDESNVKDIEPILLQ